MIDTLLSAALEESVADVLEKMFFVQILDGAPAGRAGAEPQMSATLSFDGDPSGSLTLCVTEDVARSVAADFLGEAEDEISPRQVGEVICELANMICGSVLSRVESTTTFQLAEPRMVAWEPPATPPDRATCHTLAIGNGSLTVILRTEP